MSLIMRGATVLSSQQAGGKARALAHMEQAGLPSSPWFVISAAAFEAGLTPALRRELDAAVLDLCPAGERVAVRSSALDEDGAHDSFAGQLETFLDVAPSNVADRVQDVWRSAFAPRVMAYRRERGLRQRACAPGVIVQRMVVPRAAGVAFSADPVSGRRGMAVVSAVAGLGESLVSGQADADTWFIDRCGAIRERHLVAGCPALSDEEARGVARLARGAERAAGCPQDVEWALTGELVLLQARPITSLRLLPDPDAPLTVWDNSNIVESYSGITTPLTFSFARDVYEHVYRQFCRIMRVPAAAVREHDAMFGNMLGLVRGRMFYNLLNWYRMLTLLPGYRVNRRFMEQMMGVKEPLPDGLIAEGPLRSDRSRTRDALLLARTIAGLIGNHLTLNRRVASFSRRLEEALRPPSPALEELRPDELVAHYRKLRGKLLLRWDAPLVNDFFAMIFYGLLRDVSARWLGVSDGALQNDFITGDGGMVSAEPAVRVTQLAQLASADALLVERLRNGSVEEILAALSRHPELLELYRDYLARFGERTVNELKLESETLHEAPLPLLRAVGALAWQLNHADDRADRGIPVRPGEHLRTAAHVRAKRELARRPFRRAAFAWILRHARRRVRDRENLRLERTRLFGRVRRIFLELGRRLHAQDVIDNPRDIFYLEVDEVLAYVDGTSTSTDLRSLAAVRKQEFERYAHLPAPADRFETRGPVYQGHDFGLKPPAPSPQTLGGGPEPDSGDRRQGLGCSPGIVRGPVRIVRDPTEVDLSVRAILVAEHTDPGWVMLFPCALGVLVERGSLLSHAAIVSRELGIPAVVSVPGLTRWLRDGDIVEMDGATGVIRVVQAANGHGETRCA